MNTLLDPSEIEQELAKIALEWSVVSGTVLQRDYEFEDFAQALKFVNHVGAIAEKQNHHPDIQLSWGKVVVAITSHSANGLTKKDFKLAASL